MTETPREYKKRIDETREKRKINRDKLLECLQEYELVDERYKYKIQKEILANFDKNEKAEKGSEFYIKIGEELSNIDLKYKKLEELKKIFEEKSKERNEDVEKLRGYSVTGEDETTLKIQKIEMKKIEQEIESLDKEISEIEKEIQNSENEIKEIEETYGEKKEVEKKEKGEKKEEKEKIEEILGIENTTKEVEIKNKENDVVLPETFGEHRRKTLIDLQKINHTRHEIIKLLNEGVGVDEDVKNKIKSEISKKFFEYYDEKTGTIKMKASKLDGLRKVTYSKKYTNIEKVMEINETPIYKVMNNGKRGIKIGKDEPKNWFDEIIARYYNIGGKLCYKAIKDGNQCIMRGDDQQGDFYDQIYEDIGEVGGKPVFEVGKDGKVCIMSGKEQISDYYDRIYLIHDICKKPCFFAKNEGKYCLIRGNEKQCDQLDGISRVEEVGGKPCYEVQKDGKRSVMRGKKQLGEGFDTVREFRNIGGKPFFKAEKNGKQGVIWGNELIGDRCENIRDVKEIGGKPCFTACKNGKYCIMRGNEQQFERVDSVSDVRDIGGKPVFGVLKDGKRCIMNGKEEYSKRNIAIRCIKEVGGKIYYEATEQKDQPWHIFRGNEKQLDTFDSVCDTMEIGGKLCFSVRKNGKWSVIRGNEQQGDWFDYLYEIKEIGGKPLFCAEKGGKQCIMWGNEQMGDRYDKIRDLQENKGKPSFYAKDNGAYHIILGNEEVGDRFDNNILDLNVVYKRLLNNEKKGEKYRMMLGNEIYSGWYDSIDFINVIGGKPTFLAKKGKKYFIMRGNEQYSKLFDEVDQIKEIGGKPCYVAIEKQTKKNKYCMFRGDGKQSDWFSNIEILGNDGKLPRYKASKNGKSFIMEGNTQITDYFDYFISTSYDECIGYKDGGFNIIRINEKSKKAINYNNNQIIIQEKGSDEKIDTQRGLRETLILARYEKLQSIKELIIYLKENGIYDDLELSQLKNKLTDSFFENYEKAKENYEFQTAEKKYGSIKEMIKKHKAKKNELKQATGADKKSLEEIDSEMLEIADQITMTQGQSFLKMFKLDKYKKEREMLEQQKKYIIGLRNDEYKMLKQIEAQLKEYLLKFNRKIIRGKSDEKLKEILSIGNIAQVKTLKEYREKHSEIIENSEKIVGFIKDLDLGINEELKNEIIDKIEKHLLNCKELQEGGDLLKIADETEKYINENIENIILKINDLKKQIQDNEEKIRMLEGKKGKAEYTEILKINDEIFELKELQIKIRNELDEIVKSTNEILKKYNGTDINSYL